MPEVVTACFPFSSSKRIGPYFLLCSIVVVTAALGVTVGRWLLRETGEVLLFFAGGPSNSDTRRDLATITVANEVDTDFASNFQADQFTDTQQYPRLVNAGERLLDIAESPYLRLVPLILLLLSAPILAVGLLLTLEKICRCWSWIQTCQEELTEKMKEKHVHLKNTLRRQIDLLVMDSVLRNWVKAGVELSIGAWGGIILYSLPKEIFRDCDCGSKNARRRLIRAADPFIENILFRIGGLWDVLPTWSREYLSGYRLPNKLEVGLGDCVLSQNREGSSDTSLTSPVLSDLEDSSQSDVLLHFARVIHANDRENNLGQDVENCPIETENCSTGTVADALSATIHDLAFFNLMGPRDKNTDDRKSSAFPSPPALHLVKFLHRTSVLASFLFLCHLRRSPITRRAWGSAASIATSIGLFSTVIGAGVGSMIVSHPIAGMLCSKIVDQSNIFQMPEFRMDISERIQRIFHLLRGKMRQDKRLQTALAFLVLNGTRSWLKDFRTAKGHRRRIL